MPPQVPLMWKLSPPIHNVRGRGVGRKLVGGKFHEGIWVMKQTFLTKWRPQSKSVYYCPTISPCKVTLE